MAKLDQIADSHKNEPRSLGYVEGRVQLPKTRREQFAKQGCCGHGNVQRNRCRYREETRIKRHRGCGQLFIEPSFGRAGCDGDNGGKAVAIQGSVADPAGIEQLFAAIRARHETSDILVNNAGI